MQGASAATEGALSAERKAVAAHGANSSLGDTERKTAEVSAKVRTLSLSQSDVSAEHNRSAKPEVRSLYQLPVESEAIRIAKLQEKTSEISPE